MTNRHFPSRAGFIFLLLLVAYGYFFPRWADWNQNSRLDLVLAFVDKGTLAIDDYYQNTGDYAAFNGHFYTDKAPGLSFAAMPVYWVFKTLWGTSLSSLMLPRLTANHAFTDTLNPAGTGILGDKVYTSLALVFVTFFVVAVPAAWLGVLFYWLVGYWTAHPVLRVGLTLAYGLATPAFAYANLFYGHQLAAFCLFVAFYLLFTWNKQPKNWRLAAAGFCLGWAVITEYPTGLIAAGLGLYAIAQVRDPRKWAWVVVGGVAPLLLLALYDYAIFGTVLPVGYEHSALWQDVHQIGFLSLTFPSAEALWGVTFGTYRGLFFLSPFLLLAVPGFVFWYRERRDRHEFWVTLWAVTSFVLFNASSAMWSGGFAVGPRYLVPMLPFLTLPIVFLLREGVSRWMAVLAGVSGGISLAMVWIETIAGQSFPQFQPNPLFDYALPRLAVGDVARNWGIILGLASGYSVLPLFLIGGLLLLGCWALAPSRRGQIDAWREAAPVSAPHGSNSLDRIG